MAKAAVSAPDAHEGPRADALSQLVQAIEDLAEARSLDDIIAVVRTRARGICGADGVSFVLRDEDRCHYVEEDAVGPLWKGSKFPLTACISGWAMLNRKTAVIPDIYVDERIPHDAYRPTFVKSLVMTPVGRDQPQAAIGAYWSKVRQPTEGEIEVLSALARATATAMENVRLVANLTESLERRDFLIRELDHRVKNMLASIQAIARQTLKTTPDPAAFVDSFNGRLMALSRAHVLLTRDSWMGAPLRAIADDAMTPFRAEAERIQISGPPISLGPVQAVAVHLAMHELMTNAIAHGALARPDGLISLDWTVDMAEEPRKLALTWRERGGPPVSAPTQRGLGLRLIEQGLPHALDGVARTDFEAQGFQLEVIAPLSPMVQLA